MLVKDYMEIILANVPNNFKLTELTTYCGHMRDKESRDDDGTHGSLREHNYF